MSSKVLICNNSKRFDNIDLMEFIGIFFVIVYHSHMAGSDFLGHPSQLSYMHYMLSPILSACVPMFLFANGFLLAGKELDIRKHIYKVIQLIVLTFVWGAINIVFMMWIHNDWMPLKGFIKSLWGFKQGWIHHMWYMGALICVYLFLPLIKAAIDHNRKAFNFFLVICLILTFGNKLLCMVATVVHHFLLGGNTYISFNFFNMFNPFRNLYGFAFSYFLLGCFAYMNLEKIKDFISKLSLWIFFAVTIGTIILSCILSGLWGIFVSQMSRQIWDPVMDSYDSVFTVILVIAIFLLSLTYLGRNNPVCRFIRTTSKNTLSIYLMHEIFLHLFEKAGIGNLPFMNHMIPDAIYSFLVLCLCLIIALLIQKIPVLRNLTGWKPVKHA